MPLGLNKYFLWKDRNRKAHMRWIDVSVLEYLHFLAEVCSEISNAFLIWLQHCSKLLSLNCSFILYYFPNAYTFCMKIGLREVHIICMHLYMHYNIQRSEKIKKELHFHSSMIEVQQSLTYHWHVPPYDFFHSPKYHLRISVTKFGSKMACLGCYFPHKLSTKRQHPLSFY